MNRIQGLEFHNIIANIFGEVHGLNVSEQLQVNCPRCAEELGYPDGKFNLEINTANNKRKFRCWRCDEPKFSGSLGRLIRTFGTSFDYDLYKSYASIYGNDNYNFSEIEEIEYAPVILPKEMILFSQMNIENKQHFEAYNYLINERKISRDIILKYRLGFCIIGKYAKRIIIPSYNNNGEINYFVARAYDKTLKNKYDNPKSDKDKIIFNEGLVNWDSTIFLVEGAFEMLSLPVNCIPMLGKTLSTTLFMKLKELKPDIVIILDPDAYKNAVELFFVLHNIYVDCEERVKLVKLPTKDDLDELRRNQGIDAVLKSLRTARGLTVDDYFIKKLNPYEGKNRRYDFNSGNSGWKSGSTRSYI
jgi:hypothetical protein